MRGDPPTNGFARVRSGIDPHVRTFHMPPPPLKPLVYLGFDQANRAQIWYAPRDQTAHSVPLYIAQKASYLLLMYLLITFFHPNLPLAIVKVVRPA